MGEKNKVKLKITGSEFVISAEEDKDYIIKISRQVDKRITELADENPNLSVSMATILSALNYCDELEKEKKITAKLLKELEEAEQAIEANRMRANEANEKVVKFAVENEQLQEEKRGLHARIEELKERLARAGIKTGAGGNNNRGERQTADKAQPGRNSRRPEAPGQRSDRQQTRPAVSSKIDYRENDKISDEYRRDDFQDSTAEDEMISFFDNR